MDGWVTIGTKLDTKDFDKQIEEVKAKIEELEEVTSKGKELGFSSEQIRKAEIDLEKLKNKYIDLQKKQIELSKTNVFGNISKSMTDIIKKVAKWSLAIVGIRSIYLGIRQAMSTLTSYDDKLKANVDYMKFALANALKPIIEWILKAMYQILSVVAQIVYLLTGKNIFQNSGIKDFQKAMNKSAGSAKEIKKQLAGFDEMNVLSNNSSAGGGGGATMPDMDLSKAFQGEIPAWLQWFVDNKDLVVAGLIAIGSAIALMKLGELVISLQAIGTVLTPLLTFIGKNATVIGGIVLIVGGLALAIKGVIDYLKDPTWENFGKILLGIGVIATGVFAIFGGVPAIITAIIGVIVALALAIYKNWDSIKEFISSVIEKIVAKFELAWTVIKTIWKIAKDWFKSTVITPIVDLFNTLKTKVTTIFTNIKTKATDIFGSIKTFIVDKVISPIKTKFEQLGEGIKNIVTGIGNFLKGIGNVFIDTINLIIKGLNLISVKVPDWVPKYGGKKWGFDITPLPRLARGGIVHNPGPGVMMGSYVAGEGKYPEAVLPLDDNTMDRLGEAIARHMTINANITNNMNGRVISRELQKINAENTFAFNS